MKKILFILTAVLVFLPCIARADMILPRGSLKENYEYCVRVHNDDYVNNYIFVANRFDSSTSDQAVIQKLDPNTCLGYKDKEDNLTGAGYYREFPVVNFYDRKFISKDILDKFDSLPPGSHLPEDLWAYFKDPYYLTGGSLPFLSVAGELVDGAPIKKITRDIYLKNPTIEQKDVYFRVFFKSNEKEFDGCVKNNSVCYYPIRQYDEIRAKINPGDSVSVSLYYKDNGKFYNARYKYDFTEKSEVIYDDGTVKAVDKQGIEAIDDKYAIYPVVTCNMYDGHCYKYGECVDCVKPFHITIIYIILFFATVLVESVIFYLFGSRRFKNFVYLFVANLVSYPTALAIYNFLYILNNHTFSPFDWVITELLVVMIEVVILTILLRKHYSKKEIMLFTLVANVVTAVIGLFLRNYLIIF